MDPKILRIKLTSGIIDASEISVYRRHFTSLGAGSKHTRQETMQTTRLSFKSFNDIFATADVTQRRMRWEDNHEC